MFRHGGFGQKQRFLDSKDILAKENCMFDKLTTVVKRDQFVFMSIICCTCCFGADVVWCKLMVVVRVCYTHCFGVDGFLCMFTFSIIALP